jgi:hypothetical protein
MRSSLLGKPGGVLAFALIAVLVCGGLGWAGRAALRLERERREQQAQVEHADKLRLALWRMDGRLTAFVAREGARPFNHYAAVFIPAFALDGQGRLLPPGAVVEPSPLLADELPEWALLHFQADAECWSSPQAPTPRCSSAAASSPATPRPSGGRA